MEFLKVDETLVRPKAVQQARAMSIATLCTVEAVSVYALSRLSGSMHCRGCQGFRIEARATRRAIVRPHDAWAQSTAAGRRGRSRGLRGRHRGQLVQHPPGLRRRTWPPRGARSARHAHIGAGDATRGAVGRAPCGSPGVPSETQIRGCRGEEGREGGSDRSCRRTTCNGSTCITESAVPINSVM